jgi:hypothetical protein
MMYTHVAVPVSRHHLSHIHLSCPLLLNVMELVWIEPISVPDLALVRSCLMQKHTNPSKVDQAEWLTRSRAPSKKTPDTRNAEQASDGVGPSE